MPLLRFESSRDLSTNGLAADCESARDQFVAKHQIDFQDDSNLQPRLPNDLPFFALPEQQLLAYEKHREESELGHIFRIANGLHDHIDALVVFAACGGSVGGQAIYQACCDPYHNEFSRAARGSKPRIYFADAGMDNDQLQSLLGRLRGGGYGDGPAENRWAIIVSADEFEACHDCSVLDQLLAEQIRQNDPVCQDPPPRSVTLIGEPTATPMSAAMLGQLRQKGFEGPLRISESLLGGYRVLTPVALLPAAFLGLDCIQLLVGAAAINENFCQAPFESNLVLQFAAANRAPAGNPTAPRQIFAWWARSLAGLDRWRLSLNPGQRRPGEQPWDIAIESHGEGFCQLLQSSWFGPQEIVVNHVVVDAIRTDPLRVEHDPVGQGAPAWLPARQRARQTEAWAKLDSLGVCQNTIHLPVVDTHSLGQLMQMMMLASALSSGDDFAA